jgi:hypothetical protein
MRTIAGLALIGFLALPAAFGNSLNPIILSSFQGYTATQDTCGCVPSDMAMAVGPGQIVQIVNGGYEVFDRSGNSLTGALTDVSFWNNAGISSTITSQGIFDPRVEYDPVSQRFFATEDTAGSGASNDLMLAVSKTSNPMDGWNAVNFTAATGLANGFADFPTLGIDQNGVYIGTNNFDPNVQSGISVFSIPKADLLGITPSIANMTSFVGLSSASYGMVPQTVLDLGGANGAILAQGPMHQAMLYNVTGSSGPGASISGTPIVFSGLTDGSVLPPRQPGGSSVTINIDNRFSATPVVVGNFLYAVNSVGDDDNNPTHDLIHWMIVNLVSNLMVAQGSFDNPNFDYIYPSISADANGDFMITYNSTGPGATSFLSSYAEACHFDGTNASCGSPLLMNQGQSVTFDGRWGDYSVTAVDPANPGIFWAANNVTDGNNNWISNITELSTVATPEPGTLALLGATGMLLALVRRR